MHQTARQPTCIIDLRLPKSKSTFLILHNLISRESSHNHQCPKPSHRCTIDVLKELGIKDSPLLDVAMELEKFALSDKYFIDRKLYPNIDFYAGIILKAIGFPVSMFTMLFAVARTPGWIAQWKEMIEDPSQKIGRPRQLYIGSPRRDYVAIDKRS